jgi:hyperosmotically inducible periplasmic protein
MGAAGRPVYGRLTVATAACSAKESIMTTASTSTLRLTALALAVAATLGLAACNKPGEATVGEKVDGAIAGAKESSAEATQTVKTGAMDATITTKINTALAADSKLSAIKIDVDTVNGRVTLTGTAPDADSRQRATTLATAVDGVTSVDNRLAVQGS